MASLASYPVGLKDPPTGLQVGDPYATFVALPSPPNQLVIYTHAICVGKCSTKLGQSSRGGCGASGAGTPHGADRRSLTVYGAEVTGCSSLYVPVVCPTPSTRTPPLPVKADLNYISSGPEALETTPAPYPRGKVPCSMCSSQIALRQLRLHVGGCILDEEVRP